MQQHCVHCALAGALALTLPAQAEAGAGLEVPGALWGPDGPGLWPQQPGPRVLRHRLLQAGEVPRITASRLQEPPPPSKGMGTAEHTAN